MSRTFCWGRFLIVMYWVPSIRRVVKKFVIRNLNEMTRPGRDRVKSVIAGL